MSLTQSINIGRTALNASQIGIQVAGNNMANATTAGYSRQVARMSPIRGGSYAPQVSIGAGVQITGIQRQIDEALQSRLWQTTSDQAAADAMLNLYSSIEGILGELGDNDLSSELSAFFASWSERANQTRSSSSVVQQGEKLANFIRRVRTDLSATATQAERELGGSVVQANELLNQIATLNGAISDAEIGNQPANVLRDQRDELITQLSALMPVTVVDRGREGTDVLVGSVPVVLGSQSRGLEVSRFTDNDGNLQLSISTKVDGSRLSVESGAIGALLASQGGVVGDIISKLDDVASQLIWEVNKLHATGTTTAGYTRLSGQLRLSAADRGTAMNDPTNEAFDGLPFKPVNGGFMVRVKHSSGATTETRIDIDLDGRDSTGARGFGDDTTMDDIIASLNAVDGIRASYNASGQLEVTAEDGFTFNFQDDSSNVLASIGMNAFYTGSDASDIRVRSELQGNPNMLAAGRIVNKELVENGTALALSQLQDKSLDALGGRSLAGLWRDTVQQTAAGVADKKSAAQAAATVRDSLLSQVAAVSGVSIDEESINLLQFQRMYQGAARLISVADEMTQTLINLI